MKSRKKILCVEDDALNRKLLIQLLGEDYTLVLAADGSDAVRQAVEEKPDLILMDLKLPVMDGLEATRRIKARSDLARTPVIAVTAYGMEGDEERARAAGCDDFLLKPIHEDRLFCKVRKYIGAGEESGEEDSGH